MPESSGKQTLYAAALLGGAVLIGGILIGSELHRVNRKLDDVGLDLADIRTTLGRLQQTPPPSAARQPARPDPDRRYTVNTAGAPALGPPTAPVKIVEFSDFQ